MSRSIITCSKIICINCPKGCRISIKSNGGEIEEVKGYQCLSGKKYAYGEFKNPTRILPTTIRVKNGILPLASVKTSKPIPKSIIFDAMEEIAQVEVEAPVEIGQIIIEDLMNSGVNLVATRSIMRK